MKTLVNEENNNSSCATKGNIMGFYTENDPEFCKRPFHCQNASLINIVLRVSQLLAPSLAKTGDGKLKNEVAHW